MEHMSDCAKHNMPALPNGKCDCKLGGWYADEFFVRRRDGKVILCVWPQVDLPSRDSKAFMYKTAEWIARMANLEEGKL